MGIFSGINNAEIFERGNFMAPNFEGIVEVKKTIAKDTRKNGMAFIVEMRVVESNMPDKHAVDSKATWYQGMKDTTVAFPAIAAWAAACAGYEPSQKEQIKTDVMPILEQLCDDAVAKPEENAFVGHMLKLRTWQKKTLKGLDFTVYDFHPHKKAA